MSPDRGPMTPTEPGGDGAGTSQGLGALVSGVRRLLLRRAIVTLGLWLLIAAAAILSAAWLLSGPGGWGPGSTAPLLLDVAFVVAAAAGAWLLARVIRGSLSEVRIARALDRIGGFGSGTVLGSLELSRANPPGVSMALARSSEASVLRALPADDPDSLARPLGTTFRRWTRRAAGVLALALPGLILLAVTRPARTLTAWNGLLRPAAVLAEPPLPPLRVEPAEGPLPRGSRLEVGVEARGRERVSLRWQFDGDVARTRDAEVRGGRARFDLGALEAPVEYQAAAPDGARSPSVRIEPQDPLLVTDLRVELVYPSHTGRSPEQFRRDVPPLRIPVGTRIRIDGRTSRRLESVGLRSSEGEDSGRVAAELGVEGDRFSGRWRPRRSGRYEWVLRASDGSEPASVPSPLELTLVADSAPSVELTFPGRDTVLPLSDRQPLVIRATDDYGLGSLELVAYRVSSFGERGQPVVRELQTGGIRAAVARPVLDVSDWDLLPGDTVRYRARVADNRPRPQTAETREYVLRVARRSEAARSIQERLESAARAVDSLATAAARAAQETRELERQGTERRAEGGGADPSRSGDTASDRRQSSGAPETSSFEAREEVRRAVERQEDLLSRADSVRSALSEAQSTLDQASLADPELRDDLEELQSLMERAAPEEVREDLRRTAEELGQMSSRELEDALERMAQEQETFRERVEESLERFRRAAAEQDFRTTAREARDLADEESALADAMESGERSERRARQQQELAGRTGELEERMQELEERLSQLGEAEARQGVEEARRESRRAAREMEEAARQIEDGGPGEGEEETGRQTQERQRGERTSPDEADRESRRARQNPQEAREDRPGQEPEQSRRGQEARQGQEQQAGQGRQARQTPPGQQAGGQRDRQGQAQRDPGRQQGRQGQQGAQSGRQQSSGAARSARSASQRLQQSADGLDAARQQMSQARADRMRQAFQQASSEALSLARSQGELQERMRSAGQQERAELRGDQAALLEGLRNLSSNLSRPTSQAPEQGGEVQRAVQDAMSSVQRTLDALEGQAGGAQSPAAASNEAIEALNRAARTAARAGRQAGGQGGGGGSPQLQRQLQRVAQQQGGLAERTGSLQPMQLGPSSLRRQLGKMAGEQESVADELGELARRPGSGEALGDLERMAEEARDLAGRLEGGRLEPETVRRQERLFHRLLDAGRSLEKDERSRERESRSAEQVQGPEVQPLTGEDRGGAGFSLPRADVLQALPPAQRALVVRYFERLNRAGPGADGSEGGDP